MFVGFGVNNKDQGVVVVLNLLHGRLGGQGMLDDIVSVHPAPLRCGFPRIFRISSRPECPGPVEVNRGPDFLDPGAMGTLDNLFLDPLSLDNLSVWHLGLGSLGIGSFLYLLFHCLLGDGLLCLGDLGLCCSSGRSLGSLKL